MQENANRQQGAPFVGGKLPPLPPGGSSFDQLLADRIEQCVAAALARRDQIEVDRRAKTVTAMRAAWGAAAEELAKKNIGAASDGSRIDIQEDIVRLVEGGESLADPLHFADHGVAQRRVDAADQVENFAAGRLGSYVEPVADTSIDERSDRLHPQDVERLGLVLDRLGQTIALLGKVIGHPLHSVRLKPSSNLAESSAAGETRGGGRG